jgi:hypothetical protein
VPAAAALDIKGYPLRQATLAGQHGRTLEGITPTQETTMKVKSNVKAGNRMKN